MNFRRYLLGDERFIIDAFEESFGKKLSMNYWVWRYVDNPNKDTKLINLAWDENRLAAHYALSPTAIFVNGSKYNAALSMTTFTHPNYFKKGLFTKLAQELYLDNTHSLDIVFGVPNDNSINGFVNKLEFILAKEIPMLESKISNEKYKYSNKCVFVNKFDERFDDIFSVVINKYKIITLRSSNYLKWRFIDNPVNNYQTIAYVDENKILGYVVIKVYENNFELIGDIVDLIAIDLSVIRHLVSSCFSFLKSKGILKVNTWLPNKECMSVLKEFNFEENGKYFHFIIRNNSKRIDDDLLDFNNWYITMSDIDIF